MNNNVNDYRTNNREVFNKRLMEYQGIKHRCFDTNNINKLCLYKDIPDGIEILIEYANATVLRCMNIPTEIVYESIYRELPDLFEE